MSSDAQRSANQANAQKSTGPKSAEGKAKSSRNAFKHGLSGDGKVLPPEDAVRFHERLNVWTNTARPANDMERYQVASAVWATVKLDRCAESDLAETKRRRRRTIASWEGRQTSRIREIVARWHTEPDTCTPELEKFTRGCDWMATRWENLAQALETNRIWTSDQVKMALRLLGSTGELFYDDDTPLSTFRLHTFVAQNDLDADEADRFFGVSTAEFSYAERIGLHESRLPDAETALEGIWETLAEQIDRLAAKRREHWIRQDAPELSDRINLKAFDNSKTGELRRRYSSAASLEMHRCLNQFAKQGQQTAHRQRIGPHGAPSTSFKADGMPTSAKDKQNSGGDTRNTPNEHASTDLSQVSASKQEVSTRADVDERANRIRMKSATGREAGSYRRRFPTRSSRPRSGCPSRLPRSVRRWSASVCRP